MMSDYINKEDAKKWLTNLRDDCGRYQDMWHYAEALNQIIELLSTDVEPVRHGHWIEDGVQIHVEKTYHCSECDCLAWGEDEKTRYCPTCGARMDSDDKWEE